MTGAFDPATAPLVTSADRERALAKAAGSEQSRRLPDGIVTSLDEGEDENPTGYEGEFFLEGIAANIDSGEFEIARKQLKQTSDAELPDVVRYLGLFDWSAARAKAKVEELSGRKLPGTSSSANGAGSYPGILGVVNAVTLLLGEPPPRRWLLGISFCRTFISSLVADGGVGKSALRILQALSLASGVSMTGEHVHHRTKVLIVSLEDDLQELHRRVLAAVIHHNIKPADLDGWLFLSAPGGRGGKIMTQDDKGNTEVGQLIDNIRAEVVANGIGLVVLDPFVKSHSVPENDNSAIDDVMQLLTDMAAELNIAVDLPHHTSKGPADPGNANRSRGASGMKDAARLVYTLCPMTPEEAQPMGVQEADRRRLIRMDSAKVNVAPPLDSAKWFRLVGVDLGNGDADYPHGDEVQTVEVWTPPDTWAGLSHHLLNEILTAIDKGLPDGNRYSDGPNVTDRAAWKAVIDHANDRTEKQARDIIKTWVKTGVLTVIEYENPTTRKTVKGVRVNDAKRPS